MDLQIILGYRLITDRLITSKKFLTILYKRQFFIKIKKDPNKCMKNIHMLISSYKKFQIY